MIISFRPLFIPVTKLGKTRASNCSGTKQINGGRENLRSPGEKNDEFALYSARPYVQRMSKSENNLDVCARRCWTRHIDTATGARTTRKRNRKRPRGTPRRKTNNRINCFLKERYTQRGRRAGVRGRSIAAWNRAINSSPENVAGQVAERVGSQGNRHEGERWGGWFEGKKRDACTSTDRFVVKYRDIGTPLSRTYRLTSLEFIVVSSKVFISCDPARRDVSNMFSGRIKYRFYPSCFST